MRYLIWREWTDDPATRAQAEAEIAALHPGDPQLAHFDSRPIDPVAFDDWLASASLAAVARVLRGHVPRLRAILHPSGLRASSSFSGALAVFVSGHDGLLASGSPSETIVAPELWNASPRGRAAVLREPDTRSPDAEKIFARIAAKDTCFAATLAEDAARFPN